jgi:polyferredoxin
MCGEGLGGRVGVGFIADVGVGVALDLTVGVTVAVAVAVGVMLCVEAPLLGKARQVCQYICSRFLEIFFDRSYFVWR